MVSLIEFNGKNRINGMKSSRLIVLICHYNNLLELDKTILSIKEDFPIDIMVVDDGSKEKPNIEHLKSLYQNGKIFLELLPQNMGVGMATNHGLTKILEKEYELTGRLDCGDTVHKGKFAKQFEFLANNPEIKLLGTWVNMVDTKGNIVMKLEHPTTHEAIQKKLFFNSAFTNSSVIFYTSTLKTTGLFPQKYNRNAEDYAFFFQFAKHFKTANLPEFLLDYVLDPNSLSSLKRKEQVLNRIRINLDNFQFNIISIKALIQNSIIYFIPRKTMIKLKKLLNYNG